MIEIILGVKDVQVPPEAGFNVVVLPIHRAAKVDVAVGLGLTVKAAVVALQPVAVLVNVNVVTPEETVVTRPVLLTVATSSSKLVHVPPDEGES
jgi:hypothetical protein